MNNSRRCSFCKVSFLPREVVCDSPVYGDHSGEFHLFCLRTVEALIEDQGTNDVAHILYP